MSELIIHALAVQGDVCDKLLCTLDESTLKKHIVSLKKVTIHRLLPKDAEAVAIKYKNNQFPKITLINSQNQTFETLGFSDSDKLYNWIRKRL